MEPAALAFHMFRRRALGSPSRTWVRRQEHAPRKNVWRMSRFQRNETCFRWDDVGFAEDYGRDDRSGRRRPLGLRLWLADVAAGLSLSRTGRSAADRRPSGAVRLFLRASR